MTAPAADLELRLSDAQRDTLVATIEKDGFAVLPDKLPEELMAECLETIDRIAADVRKTRTTSQRSVKVQNCVDRDPVFRKLMMYLPALQLCHDFFGPMFHLNQSNFISRPQDPGQKIDAVSAIGWHADGPRPAMFPRVNGVMGMHYLKFGYFLTDLRHGNGGSLMVVRGSHKRDELDGKGGAFKVEDYKSDLIKFDCEPGTVVAFHQALWHAAPLNESEVERKNCYYSYCPTWMRPVDRDFPTAAQLEGLTPEERWLLGEPRPALRWWLPSPEDATRMDRFKRDGNKKAEKFINYD